MLHLVPDLYESPVKKPTRGCKNKIRCYLLHRKKASRIDTLRTDSPKMNGEQSVKTAKVGSEVWEGKVSS